MLGFAFPVFTRVHIQHHAHVNDPDNDPDHFVSTGGPLWLIAARFFYHEVFFFKRQLWRKYELLEWFLSRLVVFSIVGCSLGPDTGQVELRFTRLTSDGGFMPPKDRTSLYKLRKFEDGWRVTGMSALPAGTRIECPSS
jgi:hypothetical protein